MPLEQDMLELISRASGKADKPEGEHKGEHRGHGKNYVSDPLSHTMRLLMKSHALCAIPETKEGPLCKKVQEDA